MNITDPYTAQELEAARRQDTWTTPKLIGLIFVTLGVALTFLYLVSP